MAYIVTNREKNITFISKDLEQAKAQYNGIEIYQNGLAGHFITISDADFNTLLSNEKLAVVNSDLSVTLRDKADGETLDFSSKEKLDKYISSLKERISDVLRNKEESTFKNELSAYKTLLENLDTSSITYPFNTTLEKYLIDQGNTVLHTLQII
jgi:hypothetical protein